MNLNSSDIISKLFLRYYWPSAMLFALVVNNKQLFLLLTVYYSGDLMMGALHFEVCSRQTTMPEVLTTDGHKVDYHSCTCQLQLQLQQRNVYCCFSWTQIWVNMTSASNFIIASLFLENNCYEQYSQIQSALFYFIRDCEPSTC